MKKISLLLLSTLMALCIFTSCSDDDDNKGTVNDSIVGTWVFKSAVATDVKTNSISNDNKVKAYIEKEAKNNSSKFIWTFDASGKVTMNDQDENSTNEGTYTIKDGILTTIWGEGDEDSYPAAIVNGTLEFKEDLTEDLQYYIDKELMFLIDELGITNREDIDNFKLEKAVVKVTIQRQ